MKKKNVAVYCGASLGNHESYEKITEKLGKWIVESNYNLVYGGGAAGLMGVIADSVLKHGGEVTGIITEFLTKREAAHNGITKLVVVETMSVRKKKMADLADIFIALPGGPGTLEEISEVISWGILNRHNNPCILFNHDGYFEHLKKFYAHMVEEGYMSKDAYDKILFSTSFEEIENFIANYIPPEPRKYDVESQSE